VYAVEELIANPATMDGLRKSLSDGVPPAGARDAKIKLTSRCNLRCHMCRYWKNRSERSLSTEQWRTVLVQLADQGCRKVHFTGGEVFLRPDFLELVEEAIRLGMKANMTTNATLIDRERARRLARVGVNSVSISLDGPTARLHDHIRGVPGAFRKARRAVRWLHQLSSSQRRPVKLRVNFVIMADNFRRLPDMVRLAGEMGAVDLNPMLIDEKGRRKLRLSRARIEEYNREIAPQVLDLRRQYGFSVSSDKVYPFGVTPTEIRHSRDGLYARGFFERHYCLAPWLHMFFSWDGSAYACCMTNGRIPPLGNVVQSSVKEIFAGEAYQRLRREFLTGHPLSACHRCDLFLHENARLHQALARARERRIPDSVSLL
jgi:MoaA/NifB/PqqE/SkfB family radical SAM enzyme